MDRRDFLSAIGPVWYGSLVAWPSVLYAQGNTQQRADGAAWDYIGIPYPTDQVPADFYPAVPSRFNMREAWPYDPCTIPNPVPTPGGAPDEYFVRFDGDDGSAGQGGQGSDQAPRRTIPAGGTFPSGTKIFVEGSNAVNGVEFDLGNSFFTMTGTATEQCWIVGIDNPRIRAERFQWGNSSHVIIDGIFGVSDGGGSNDFRLRLADNGNSFWCIRNSILEGNLNRNPTVAGVIVDISSQSVNAKNSFIMVYNNIIRNGSDWNAAQAGADYHAVRAGPNVNYAWIIGNEIYHCRGNGIQFGNSAGQTEDVTAQIGNYYYVGGNHIYENNEPCIGVKHSANLVISQNDLHGAGGSRSNGAQRMLMNLTSDGEGANYGSHWALFNHVHDGTSAGIRDAHVVNPGIQISACIGNFIHDVAGDAYLADRSDADGERERYFVNNTVVRCGSVLGSNQGDASGDGNILHCYGNISYDIASTAHYDCTNGARDSVIERNILFNPSGIATITGSRTEIANIQDRDPMMTDPANNIISLTAESPAIDYLPTAHPIYQVFEDMYGINIRRDINGSIRPAQEVDVGAMEANTGPRPNPPIVS